ncbi:MAG: F0F1 ATP synthase subunit A [Thermodesulfobacteriota bacterium]|nr:MAG: F0F1 ATP synthase subunit A [Thermodesulfobacteriota bacterium]
MHPSIILPTFGLPAHVAVMIYISLGLIIFSYLFTRNLKIVPGKLQSIVEVIILVFVDLVEETMGPRGKSYLPFILTLTFYIFFANVMGLIPGLIPPTATLSSTVGLAITVFFLTHIIGIKMHGVKYIKHFVGPFWALAILMIPIELIGHIARPVSLSLRLFGNMMGHEQIVGVLGLLLPYSLPLFAMSTLLGLIVVFIQTFVFVLLSMMYLAGAIEESH